MNFNEAWFERHDKKYFIILIAPCTYNCEGGTDTVAACRFIRVFHLADTLKSIYSFRKGFELNFPFSCSFFSQQIWSSYDENQGHNASMVFSIFLRPQCFVEVDNLVGVLRISVGAEIRGTREYVY